LPSKIIPSKACRTEDDTELTVHGVGLAGLKAPAAALDLGNSGTSMRLMAGLMSGQKFATTLIGDESLSRRPMQRVIEPLLRMGAVIEADDGHAPLRIGSSPGLQGIHYRSPVASAQVKSGVLLAGLYARGRTEVTEPATSRDHTERMLRAFGVKVDAQPGRAALAGGQRPMTATSARARTPCWPGLVASTGSPSSRPCRRARAWRIFRSPIWASPSSSCRRRAAQRPTRESCSTFVRRMLRPRR
jgi:hypothetical protein